MKERQQFVDAGLAESEQYEPDAEVLQEFVEAQRLAARGEQPIYEGNANPIEPVNEGFETAWDRDYVGEEAVGGANPTPDQDVVEELGAAVGITYEDNEPLHTAEKLEERDRNRWELDPASSEDYQWRVNHECE